MVQSAQEILNYLRADLIEDDDTQDLIEKLHGVQSEVKTPSAEQWKRLAARRTLSSNSIRDEKSIQRWEQANQWVGEQIQQGTPMTLESLKTINKLLKGGDARIRKTPLFTGDMQYLPPPLLEEALKDLEKCMNADDDSLAKAFQVYLMVVTIHPFENGNGRTARLAADWILMANSYLPLCFDSPIQSHVAITLNAPLRIKEKSQQKFLNALINSYKILQS